MKLNKVAEVISSSTRRITAEVHREATKPPFGSWVEIPISSGITLFGVVYHMQTEPYDTNRQTIAFNLSREEMQREMPHIATLVRTVIEIQVLAYRDITGTVRQTLPPMPADLHDQVFLSAPETLFDLAAPYDYFRMLLGIATSEIPIDDLLVAIFTNIVQAQASKELAKRELLLAGRTLSRLLNDDHERLQSILRRVQF